MRGEGRGQGERGPEESSLSAPHSPGFPSADTIVLLVQKTIQSGEPTKIENGAKQKDNPLYEQL